MAIRTNSLEGGTATVAISAANSGGTSGTAFDAVSVAAGGVLEYATAPWGTGIALHATAATQTNQVYAEWVQTLTEDWGRAYFYFPSTPSGDQTIVTWRTVANGHAAHFARRGSDGKLVVQNAPFASNVAIGSTVIATGTLYRLEWHLVPSATVGSITWNLYSGHSSTVIDSGSATAQNFGADIGRIRFALAGSGLEIYMDDLLSGASAFPGAAIVASVAPPMAGVGDLVTPVVSSAAILVAPTQAGVGDLVTPAVGVSIDATVTALPMAGVGDIPAPGGGAITAEVVAATAFGTGALVAPTVAGGITTTPMAGTGALVLPNVNSNGNVIVVLGPHVGIGAIPSPVVAALAPSIIAVPALAVGGVIVPIVTSDIIETAPPLAGLGSLLVPGVIAGVSGQVVAPPALAVGVGPAPSLSGGANILSLPMAAVGGVPSASLPSLLAKNRHHPTLGHRFIRT